MTKLRTAAAACAKTANIIQSAEDLVYFAVSSAAGRLLFAHPLDAPIAAGYALKSGHDQSVMASKPGEVMGNLAYAHPFLDGNGRTIMVIHTELAQRAGISIEWATTNKIDYLTALTRELESPGEGHLDSYLKPFLRQAVGQDRLAAHVARVSGLDGNLDQPLGANEVLGRFSDPALQARYQRQQKHRHQQRTDREGAASQNASDYLEDRGPEQDRGRDR